MSKQDNLFEDLPLDPYLGQSKESLSLVISIPKLGAQQRLFNDCLAKIDKYTRDIEALKQLELGHGAERAKKLQPLEQEMQNLHEKVVLHLDQRLKTPKGLSKKQFEDVSYVAAVLADALDTLADISGKPLSPELQKVVDHLCSFLDEDDEGDGIGAPSNPYDKMQNSKAAGEARTPIDIEAELAEVKRMMSRMTGIDFDDDFGADAKTPEEFMALVQQKLHAQQEAAQLAHHARQAKRKKSTKQQEAELKAQQESMDADTTLRTIYRKLASALHPDREPNEAERLRKTQLMGQVNAANDAKDLLTLLRLQLQVEQINPLAIATMADDKLKSYNRMLKEQVQTVQNELRFEEDRLRHQWQLGWDSITPKSVEAALRQRLNELREQNQFMQEDLRKIQDDKFLKSWVKLQIRDIDASQSLGMDWL